MKTCSILAFLMVLAFVFGGCATAPTAELKEVQIMGDGKAEATDARLRIITHIKPGIASRPGKVDPNIITCTEPSPDVAAALARSAGFGISILSYGSASLSGSQVEGIAQLAERTAAIQALLHQGYQACLDYANGAITGTTYSLRTSRLDDLLVTLILGETAGGAFGRSGAAIGTKANASAQASLTGFPEMMKDLDKAKKDLDAADAKVNEKEDAYNQAKKAYDDAANDDPKKAQLKAESDAKKAELDAANAERNAMVQKLSAQAVTVSNSAAEVNQIVAMGGLNQKPDAEIAKVLGEMQRRFLDKDIDQAYVSACLTELGQWKIENEPDSAYQKLALKQLTDRDPNKANSETDKNSLPSLSKNDKNQKDQEGLPEAQKKDIGEPWITKESSMPFFLGTQLGAGTLLSEHCRKFLPTFINNVHSDSHDIKLKELELESKRLDILNRQTSAPKGAIHPLASFNMLEKDKKELDTRKTALDGLVIPPGNDAETRKISADLSAEKATLTIKVAGLLASADKVIADKAKIQDIENEYISLVTDTGQNGTPTEKKIWQAKADLQQANAEAKDNELIDLSKEIKMVISEADAFVQKAKKFKG